MLRASGVAYDARMLGYAAYGDLDFAPVTAEAGDSYARCEVRIREIYQSIGLIRQAVQKIPEGPIAVPVKGNPNGEHFMRIEQPRGEAVYYVKGSGSKFIDRFPPAHADDQQHPADAGHAQGLPAGRRTAADPDHRPLHQLYREVRPCDRPESFRSPRRRCRTCSANR